MEDGKKIGVEVKKLSNLIKRRLMKTCSETNAEKIGAGGFIIGLEGVPYFKGTLTNEGALALHNPEKNYISFYYVTNEEKEEVIIHKYLKYHPRREGYTPEQVVESIKINKRRA